MSEADEDRILRVMKALRSRPLAAFYDIDEHWRDMAIAAIEAYEEEPECSTTPS